MFSTERCSDLPQVLKMSPTLHLSVLTSLLLSGGAVMAAGPDSVVTFSEIHYNPVGATEDGEWIEIHNQMAIRVDLSGWTLQGGVDFSFPAGTFIAGGGYLVIEKTVTTGLGPFTGNLDNGGETIRLHDNSDRLMDELDYGDAGEWPVAADGSGVTLAKRRPGASGGDAVNWVPSIQIGGTPGAQNFPPPGLPINHVLVDVGETWRYDDSGVAPPATWKDSGYDDSSWSTGEPQFGTDTGGSPVLTVTGNLVERFRASDITGVANGATFSTWADTATGDGTAQNASAGGNPTFQASATINGKAAVRFDGNDEMRTSLVPGIGSSSGFTYFIVCKGNGAQSLGGVGDGGGGYIFDRVASIGNPLVSLKAVGGSTYGFQKRFDNGSGLGGPSSTTAISTTDFQIVAVRRNPSQSRFEIWVDGVMESTASDSGATLTPQPIVIGRHATNTSGGFVGDIAELLIYEDALSDTDFQNVGAYLESEYALDTAFPGSTVTTQLAAAPSTYYFRKSFSFAGTPARTDLRLQHLLADGAVFYLNGTELHLENMPAGAITHGTPASSDIASPASSGFFTVPSSSLIAGTNVLAVEVHKASGGTDALFSAELAGTEDPPDPDAPAELVLNEIAAADGATFWIEFTNPTTSPIEVAGYVVSVNGDPLTEYPLPAQMLPAGGLLSLSEAQLGFRPQSGDRVFLYAPGGGGVADAQRATNKNRGRSTAFPNRWLFPSAGTPGTANTFSFNSDIVINEICYHAPADPGSNGTTNLEPLLAFGDTWRYNEAGDNLGASWMTTTHAVGGNWNSGAGALAYEPNGISLPVGTSLTNPASNSPYVITYYFEREFQLTQQQFDNLVSLSITHLIDDGAVFYINGVEVERYKMSGSPGDPVSASTTASGGGEASLTGPLQVSSASSVVGTNRISVEVHQTSTGSSDVVFALELAANTGTPPTPFQESDEAWIELFNRGGSQVDLSGWDFGDGVDFTFPVNTLLDSGDYLVVASDATGLAAKHPGIAIAGEFSGNLSRSGERVELRDANNNPVDEVRYYDGGRWPGAADGGGSSMELRDPDADNSRAEAWAASDETGESSWQTYTYQGVAAASRVGPDNQWRDFIIGLNDSGEVLIDDITVTESPGGSPVAMLSNSDFESGATDWRFRGNHRHSEVITDPDDPSNQVLRLVATGYTEHMHNNVETTLAAGRSVVNGRTYEISFKAKWISGSNQFLTRLYFNRLPRTTLIDRPDTPGTPGVANSRAVANIGPTYEGLIHSPPVPPAGAPTTVSVTPSDPDGMGTLTLFYSVESGSFSSVAMAPDAEGVYSAQIPGQSAGSVVQFYVQASDGLGATAFFPATGPDSSALYEVEDGRASGTGLGNFRLIMTPDDDTWMHTNINVMSNDRLGSTVIYNESEIFYDTGVRLKSSQRGRLNSNRLGFNVGFNADQLFRGVHRTVAIDRSQGQSPGQRELLFNVMMTSAGGPSGKYNDLVKIIAPRNAHTGTAELQLARYGEIFLGSRFEDGDDGTVFEYELIYYPTTADGNGFKIPQPDLVQGTSVRDLGDDKENYRWNFLIKNNRERDDYAAFIEYCKHFDLSGSAFHAGAENFVDVDNWLRGMAFAVLSGAGDNYAANSAHNGQFYVRPDGRVIFLPHDMDFSFSTTRSITANSDVSTIVNDPPRMRQYLGHLHDIITTTYNNSYMSGWSSHFATLDPAQNWTSSLNHITSRSNNVLTQINSTVGSIAFAITTNGGNNFTVNSSPATLSGDGWVNVREIRLAGSSVPLESTWTDNNSWTVGVPVATGANALTIEAVDFQGNVVGSDTVTITNTQVIEPASATNIVVSELHYHPADPSPSEISGGFTDADEFEFIEIKNIGPVDVDLTGAQFVDGIDFAFPSGTILASGGYLLVVRNANAFAARYPGVSGALVIGEYQFSISSQLSNGGEQIVLVDALGVDIRRFTYADDHPWPESADGDGDSLTLIAPDSDPNHNLAASWRASVAGGGSPGTSDSVPFVGDPNVDGDGDGFTAFVEHAFGTSDAVSSSGPSMITDASRHALLNFPRNLAADDVIYELQISPDLQTWTPVATEYAFESETALGDGTSTVVWRSAVPFAGLRQFLRLQVQAR